MLLETFPTLGTYWPNLRLASSKQAAFLLLDVREALYGGAAGGGKSDALLAGALQYVDVPGYAAIIFRRSFTDLALPGAALARSKDWLGGLADWNEREKTWTFPSGATLTFGYLERDVDVYRYKSAEFTYIAFDELTSFSEFQYRYLFSRLRRTKLVKATPRMRAASNPGDIGHQWVKERLVDDETRKKGAAFIPARVSDNPGLVVEEYRQNLLENLDETLVEQLLEGNWEAFVGMAFSKFGSANKIRSFQLDDSIARIEAMDYGLNGTAWGLVATDYDGNVIFVDTIEGKNLLPDEVCDLVIQKRKYGWGFGNTVWGDPSLQHRTYGRGRWGQPATVASEFVDNGVPLAFANNDPRAGMLRLKTLIEPREDRRFPSWHPRVGEYGAPQMFVVESACKPLVKALTTAPVQPIDKPDAGEKINPDWEAKHGHFTAMARYAVMSKPEPSKLPAEQEPEDPRAALLWRDRKRAEKVLPMMQRRYVY